VTARYRAVLSISPDVRQSRRPILGSHQVSALCRNHRQAFKQAPTPCLTFSILPTSDKGASAPMYFGSAGGAEPERDTSWDWPSNIADCKSVQRAAARRPRTSALDCPGQSNVLAIQLFTSSFSDSVRSFPWSRSVSSLSHLEVVGQAVERLTGKAAAWPSR